MPTWRTVWNCALLAVLLSVCSTVLLRAQSTGTISGFVTDASGAPVPSASVTALLVEQQVRRTSQTGTDGFFNFTALLPGEYTLIVEKQGFQRLSQTGAVLTVN